MQWPMKKCFRTAKVCVLVMCALAVTVTVRRWFRGPDLDNYEEGEGDSYEDEEASRMTRALLSKEPDGSSPRGVYLADGAVVWMPGSAGWRGAVGAALEADFERQVLEDEARLVPGLGEGGAPAWLPGAPEPGPAPQQYKYAMNVHLSDMIPYNRSVGDRRNPECNHVIYDASLPSASVVIIFHNEPYSVVLRTIWSVVTSARRDRPWYSLAYSRDSQGRPMTLGYPGQDPSSSLVYLKEIILVDDNSTLPELKGKLSHYVRTRLPPDLIRILRLPERIGLTRARLAGARAAAGDVLVFLDAHCEAQPDWLRPLLQRVKDAPHAVVMPIIDAINNTNFKYGIEGYDNDVKVGGFSFQGWFTWIPLPEREQQRRGSEIAPARSATMAGGLFAMSREYYFAMGAYDEQMYGWGGENIEISFRIWQCGGTLEVVPCSRVGHVFRSFHPYGLPASSDTFGINTARMAEVWMDDYKELFYLHRPDLRNNPKVGDVSSRKLLRLKLHCNSFEWYLQHVYPEKFVPVRDAIAYGRFRNDYSGLCLDHLRSDWHSVGPLAVYACHTRRTLHAGSQEFMLSRTGQLRDEDRCAVYRDMGSGEKVHSKYPQSALVLAMMAEWERGGEHLLFDACHLYPDAQKWVYTPSKQLMLGTESTGGGELCLEAGAARAWRPAPPGAAGAAGEWAGAALMRNCSLEVERQRWEIDYSHLNNYGLTEGVEPSDVEKALKRLRESHRPAPTELPAPTEMPAPVEMPAPDS